MNLNYYHGVASRGQHQSQRFALLTQRQWLNVALFGLFAAAVGSYFSFISDMIPLGFALAGIVTGHLTIACRYSLPLPQTAILIATIYYLFAPIVNIYFPTANPLFNIADPEAYFNFAIPCLWATACGWGFAFYRAKPIQIPDGAINASTSLCRSLDGLIAGGMCIGLAMSVIKLPSSLNTLAMLAANVQYIGVFGWVLMSRPGWKWRLILVLTIDLYNSVSSGFFLNFLLWTLNAVVVITFRQRFSTSKLLLGMVIIIVLLPCFQHAKWELRRASWGVASDEQRLQVLGVTYQLNAFNKIPLMIAKVVESSFTLYWGENNDEFIGDTAVRYNQGWIVGRVQQHVPSIEPYANGQTVYDAAVASLVPRLLMPDKLTAGGGQTFTKYSGIPLNANTSMNLGFVGEMYANYGYGTGIIACGLYGLFFAIIFQRLVSAARSHIMILSFIPYILNFAVVSEVGLVDVLNYTVKSMFVAFAIYAGVPAVFARLHSHRRSQAPQQLESPR